MMVRSLSFLLLCVLLTGVALGQGGQPIYQGSLRDFEALPHLSVSLTKDQTVSYAIQLSSNYVYGTSVSVEGFNHEGVALFSKSIYTGSAGNVVTAMLPAGIGHLDPYRGTAHAVGRPSYLVVKSLWAQVNYSVFETKNERDGYNQGGLSRAQAKQISVFETVRGNAHWIEGNDLAPGDGTEPGGQWFKVTLEPRQTIRPEGTVLGHSYYGAAFTIQLCDESGSYLATLAGISAYGNVPFPTTQAPGSYLYQNTASEPKTFYLQVYSKVGIVHDYEFSLVEIMMDLSLESFRIDKSNNYSEDHTIRITAVRGDTRAPITGFSGSVAIAEVGTERAYNKNGGWLPSAVSIPAGSGGTATFLVRSLVGPRVYEPVNNRTPLPSLLRSPGFRHTAGVDLEVPQWRCSVDPPLPTKATGCVPDWMQHRVMDLMNNPLSPADLAAISAVESFASEDLGIGTYGTTSISHTAISPIVLNPFDSPEMRLDGNPSLPPRCGQSYWSRILTITFFHEARPSYQSSVASQLEKDGDKDYLVIEPYLHAPNEATVDSTETRTVCDTSELYPASQIKSNWVYRGDQYPDSMEGPDWVLWALEMDAYAFGAKVRNY